MMKKLEFLLIVFLIHISCQEANKATESLNTNIATSKAEQASQSSVESERPFDSTGIANSIPKVLTDFIHKDLVNLKIPSLSDFDPNWYAFYDEVESPPFFTYGYFNEDSVLDYSMILFKDSYQVCVYSFHSDKASNGFEAYLLKNYGGNPDKKMILSAGLFKEPKGKVEGMESSIHLQHDGIVFSKFEKSSTLFYWEDGKYKEFSGG